MVRVLDLITKHAQLDLHNPSAGVSSSGCRIVLLKDRGSFFWGQEQSR